jgi:hypothetical protein
MATKSIVTVEEHAVRYIARIAANPSFTLDEYCQQNDILAVGHREALSDYVMKKLSSETTTDNKLEIDNFIFDENKVMRKIIFPAGNIDGIDYFGFLLPKKVEVKDKDDMPLGIFRQEADHIK